MEKTLYLQSENTSLELKHYDDNDMFALNFLTEDGKKYLSSYSREEFEKLSEAIIYLLKSNANVITAKTEAGYSEDDIMNAVQAIKSSSQGRSGEADMYERRVTIQPVPEELWDLAHAYVDTGL